MGIVSLRRHHNNIDTEISYQLLPEWWRRGYGTEAIQAIITYVLTVLGLPRVIGETQMANTTSCHVLVRVWNEQSKGLELNRAFLLHKW